MAITEGTLLEVTLDGLFGTTQVMNVWQFEVGGTFSGITAGSVANAWWQHMKSSYRALVSDGSGPAFTRVKVRDLSDPTGDYGEYAVPTNEQAGTRSTAGSEFLPFFNAAGARLTVGTRVTRPGQKRFPWLVETDSQSGVLTATPTTLVNNILDAAIPTLTLGAPALGMDLNSIVVRKDPATGEVTAYQPVTGWAINPYVTSQVSRKRGKGS